MKEMKIFKRAVIFLLAVVFVFHMCGCATLKRKFVRKTKKGKTTPILVTQDYRGAYTNEVLYGNHFVYWQGWTDELMEALFSGLSNKRQIESANMAVEDLRKMQDLLSSPKKEELSAHIKAYEDMLAKIRFGQPNRMDAIRMREALDKEKRSIMREFATKKVKPFIITEEESIKPITTLERTLPGQ